SSFCVRSPKSGSFLYGENAKRDFCPQTTFGISSYKAISVERTALDRKSTRLNSSHVSISYAVFCLKKKKHTNTLVLQQKEYLGIYILSRKEYISSTTFTTR